MWPSLALTASRRIGHQCNVCWLHILSSAWYCRVFRTFEFVCTPSACIRPVSPNVLHPLCFAEFVVESSMPKAVNNYTDQLYVHRVITSFECSSCSSRLIVPHFFPPVDGIIVMQSNAKMILDTWKGVFFLPIFTEIVHIDIL